MTYNFSYIFIHLLCVNISFRKIIFSYSTTIDWLLKSVADFRDYYLFQQRI
jgi:hypothetical protein